MGSSGQGVGLHCGPYGVLRGSGGGHGQPKSVFLIKNANYPKKQPKFLKRLIFILEMGTFFFEQLFPVVARTRLELRSELFLVQNLGFWPKIPIFAIRPQIRSTARLLPSERSFIWGQFFDFSFLSDE